MKAYICSICGYLYNEESADKNIEGVKIPFDEVDDEWVCPNCGVKSEFFVPAEECE